MIDENLDLFFDEKSGFAVYLDLENGNRIKGIFDIGVIETRISGMNFSTDAAQFICQEKDLESVQSGMRANFSGEEFLIQEITRDRMGLCLIRMEALL